MEKNDIIEKLFTGENFNCCINRMNPEHLREDLRQEVILVICELPDEKVIGMHGRGELEFYTVRVILNTIQNSYSQFSKNFRDCFNELTGNEEIKDLADSEQAKSREEKEKLQDKVLRLINTTDKIDSKWYHKELLKIYMKEGNYREVSNKTLIPFSSVFKSVTEYKKSLNEIYTNPIYTQKQAAKILNVSRMTLWNWEQKKIIKPAVRQQYRQEGSVYTKTEIERVKATMRNSSMKARVANLKEEDLNNLPPLNAKIIKLYNQLGNLQTVGKHIGLHYGACVMNVKSTIQILEAKSQIKQGIENQKLLDQPSLNHLNLMNTLEYLNQKNVS